MTALRRKTATRQSGSRLGFVLSGSLRCDEKAAPERAALPLDPDEHAVLNGVTEAQLLWIVLPPVES